MTVEAQCVTDLLLDAAVKQGIPAHDQVVEVAAPVAEVAIGRPAALAEEFDAGHHVHAAVDDPVELLADDEALDGGVAEDGNEESAFAAVLVHGMAKVGEIEDGYAEKLEVGVGGGGHAVVELDGAGNDLPVRLGKVAVGHGAVDEAVVVVAGLEDDPGGKQEGSGGGVDGGAAGASGFPASR